MFHAHTEPSCATGHVTYQDVAAEGQGNSRAYPPKLGGSGKTDITSIADAS